MKDKEFLKIMQKYSVEAKSVEDFIRRYHVRNRMYQEEFSLLVQGGKEEIEKCGYNLLPAHISITGHPVTYFPKKQAAQA
jgi:hypothetical protein